MLGGGGCTAYALCALMLLGPRYIDVVQILNAFISITLKDFRDQGNSEIKEAELGMRDEYWHPSVVYKAIMAAHLFLRSDNLIVWRKKNVFTFEVDKNYLVDGILNERYIDSKNNVVETDPGAIFNPRDPEWRHSVAVVARGTSHVVCCRGLPGGNEHVSILGLNEDGTLEGEGYLFCILKVYEAYATDSSRVPLSVRVMKNWKIMREQNPNPPRERKKRRK